MALGFRDRLNPPGRRLGFHIRAPDDGLTRMRGQRYSRQVLVRFSMPVALETVSVGGSGLPFD